MIKIKEYQEMRDIKAKIEQYIPIAKNMQFQVKEVSEQGVGLLLPLEPNKNHMGSAFGGSLHMAAVLSCWALLEELLSARYTDYNIVIQSSQMKYLKPVLADFTATSQLELELREDFFRKLNKKKKARIYIPSEIQCDGEVCAQFKGGFVAQTL